MTTIVHDANDVSKSTFGKFLLLQLNLHHGSLSFKRIKFTGLVLNKAGELSQAELFGPPDIGAWRACYEVCMNSMVMLDAIDLGTKPALSNSIQDMERKKYGPSFIKLTTGHAWSTCPGHGSVFFKRSVRQLLRETPQISRRIALGTKRCRQLPMMTSGGPRNSPSQLSSS